MLAAGPGKSRALLALLVFANIWLTAVGTQRTVYRAGDEIVTITRTKVDQGSASAPGAYSYYTYTADSVPQSDVVYYTNANGITTRRYQSTGAGSVLAGTRRIAYDDGTATEGIGTVLFVFVASNPSL
ncbi:hypothetical protein ZHAS_00008022 [Anopheles sinensis]|uniref:Uncharacterized protein n=1 Tax=Anopheles sinensis TaxID=74873 RepID=A0A084VRD4_ANOSI|nr:hypothetical protein ZHAS_00008022 [Anopheles sinensis]